MVRFFTSHYLYVFAFGKNSSFTNLPKYRYNSIKEQQEQLLKDKMKNWVDSEESESDEDSKNPNDKDGDFDEPDQVFKVDPWEVLKLKKQLVEFLQPKENVQKALIRLKGTTKHVTKKKNQRTKRRKTDENEEAEEPVQSTSNDEHFDKLMTIVTQLFDMKYIDVYIDSKENIEFEIEQDEIKIQREQSKAEQEAREKLESLNNPLNWWYKLEYSTAPENNQTYGPFTPEQMEQWKSQDFFKENDEYIVAFKQNKCINDENVEWKFIDEIDKF